MVMKNIDGGVAVSNFHRYRCSKNISSFDAMEERQIASMRAAQKDVADMFYSRSGASGGSAVSELIKKKKNR